jgi:hypothetical protein
MQANAFSWSPESLDKLTTSVQEGFAGKDMAELEARRDEKLIGILKMKGGRRGSV